jgi:hypothetical protein
VWVGFLPRSTKTHMKRRIEYYCPLVVRQLRSFQGLTMMNIVYIHMTRLLPMYGTALLKRARDTEACKNSRRPHDARKVDTGKFERGR